MYFSINKNEYLVNGATNSCIYDLPNNQIHIINKDLAELLTRVINGEDIVDNKELEFLSYLVSLNILSETEQPIQNYNSIDNAYKYPRKIDFAWIELTNKCNLKCIHCYNEQGTIPKTTLTLQDLKHVIDELKKNGVKKVQLIGGEPFVLSKKILFEMIDYVALHMEDFEVFTNGTLINESDLIYLKDKYPNINIATSLHSYIEEEHEKVTNIKGSFQKTLSTLKSLSRLGIPHRFVGTLIGGICIGEDCGVGKPSRRDYIRLSGRANLNLYDDDLLKKRIITEKKIQSGNIEEKLKYNFEKSCYATHLYIGSDMNVYPCPMERRIFHGNLREEPLCDMIKDDIINLSKNKVNGCRDCEYRYLCLDCRPDSLNGDLYEKPWYCAYNPDKGTWDTFEEMKVKLGLR